MPNIQELYKIESDKLLALIESKIDFYVSNQYKSAKNLDIYDLWQIVNKVQEFDTDLVEVKYLKRSVAADLADIAQNIEKEYRSKINALNATNTRIQEEICCLKKRKRQIIFKSLFCAQWPFQKEYNDADYKIITLQNKIKFNNREIVKLQENRASINTTKINEIVGFLKEKYFFAENTNAA